MYSRPALPNICGAGGAWVKPRFSFIASNVRCIGMARSMYLMPSEPFSIFSKPSASVQSARPPSMKRLARYSADRTRRAVVVDVHDRHAADADLVQRALAGGGVAVAVAHRDLLDLVVGDAGVGERVGAGFLGHVRVVPVLAAGLLELGHPHTDDEHLATHDLLPTPRCAPGAVASGAGRKGRALPSAPPKRSGARW